MKKTNLKKLVHSKQEVEWYMKSMDYEKIGVGGSAMVFAKSNKPYVVKVYQNDRCYEGFLKLARKNSNNPYYPKFYNKTYTLPGKTWKAIKLEKLSPITIDDLEKNINFIAALAVEERRQRGGWFSNTGLADTLILLGYYSNDFDKLIRLYYEASYLEQTTAEQIISFIQKSGCDNDLYINNFMKRGKQLVVTDPVA